MTHKQKQCLTLFEHHLRQCLHCIIQNMLNLQIHWVNYNEKGFIRLVLGPVIFISDNIFT